MFNDSYNNINQLEIGDWIIHVNAQHKKNPRRHKIIRFYVDDDGPKQLHMVQIYQEHKGRMLYAQTLVLKDYIKYNK